MQLGTPFFCYHQPRIGSSNDSVSQSQKIHAPLGVLARIMIVVVINIMTMPALAVTTTPAHYNPSRDPSHGSCHVQSHEHYHYTSNNPQALCFVPTASTTRRRQSSSLLWNREKQLQRQQLLSQRHLPQQQHVEATATRWFQIWGQSCARMSPLSRTQPSWRLLAQPAGSFFNSVPNNENNQDKDENSNHPETLGETNATATTTTTTTTTTPEPSSPSLSGSSSDSFDVNVLKMLRERAALSMASSSESSTTKTTRTTTTSKQKPYIAIGPLTNNDPRKPEYDAQGYTLYANETTGEKSRVFEALLQYPCTFTLKIVGANEGNFVQDMIELVAESCQVPLGDDVPHTYRSLGKWLSVTVQAPVQSAQMLYQLYENVDRDPRVKFKF